MRRLLLAATLLSGLGTTASAAAIDWNFDALGPGVLPPSILLEATNGPGFQIGVRGFTASDTATALFAKFQGGDENGLGLTDDPTGADEISGKNFIQVNLDGIFTKVHGFEFSMGSTTQGEGWKVFGSNDAHPFQFTLLAQSSGADDEGSHFLPGGWDNYNFFYSGNGPNQCGAGCGANVLLSSLSATANPIPEPSTWAMLIAGFGLLAWLGVKRTPRLALS